ncbi:hypothetical protein B0O80DRAFT_460047, partial [Mortierella sp. GBAus27b]
MFKIKNYHMKQALKAIATKGIDRLITATKLRGAEVGAENPLFVIGDGEFVEALGPHVVCADEFRTSVTCCSCKSAGIFDGRAIKCPGCGKERDRDH